MRRTLVLAAAPLAVALLAACGGGDSEPGPASNPPDPERAKLAALALPKNTAPPPDVTNAFADDARAAALGKKLFFDPRFSGLLLDDSNNGLTGTLGNQGDTGKVAC
jgi:cytochrome c peroxidase